MILDWGSGGHYLDFGDILFGGGRGVGLAAPDVVPIEPETPSDTVPFTTIPVIVVQDGRTVRQNTLLPVRLQLLRDGLPCDTTPFDAAVVKFRIDGRGQKTVPRERVQFLSPRTSGLIRFVPGVGDFDAAGLATGRVYLMQGSLVGPTMHFEVTVEEE
jgi:hypothetical protein